MLLRMRRIKKGGQRFSINIKRFYDVCDPNARACGSQWKLAVNDRILQYEQEIRLKRSTAREQVK